MNLESLQEKKVYPFSYWLNKNWYYHGQLKKFYQFVIPKDVRVLHVGSKSGYLLHAVHPSLGVGIDDDAQAIYNAQQEFPHLTFIAGELSDLPQDYMFDYVILSSVTMEAYDIQQLFEALKPHLHASSRIVIDSYSYIWEPVLSITQWLGMRRPTQLRNWISQTDLLNFLDLADFERITCGDQILMPAYMPGISWFLNSFIAQIPLLSKLCLNKWVIARLKPVQKQQDYSVSIVIPCKNERGNIEAAIARCPMIGKHTEFIFVDGHSQDGTVVEMERIKKKYQDHDISIFVQDGKGKGDAVRKGFAHAKGDILMILDADLTTPPEELPKFFNALISGKGEFINGSRLIYGMESGSMRFLNLLANYCFGLGFTWLLGQKIKDTLCGTKVLFKSDYEKIVKARSFFGNFDPFGDFDLLFGAAKQNLKIIDMPIHYKNRTYGTSQIHRFQAGFLLMRMSFIAFKKFKWR